MQRPVRIAMQGCRGRSSVLRACWTARRALAILAVLLIHLALMASPLHASHGEPGAVAALPVGSDHAAVHADTPAAEVVTLGMHASHGRPIRAASRAADPADCGIAWTRAREQPASGDPLALRATAIPSGPPRVTSQPAHRALAAPTRHGDMQALLQVYRL